MKQFRPIILSLCIVAFSGCSKEHPEMQGGIENMPEVCNDVPGVVKVLLSEELASIVEKDLRNGLTKTSSKALNNALEQMGAVSMERVFPYAGRFEARTRAEGMHRWYRLVYDENLVRTKASGLLSSVPGVELIENVRKIKTADYPFSEDSMFTNPSSYYYLWHYINEGSRNRKAGADIGVDYVWRNITTGNPDVIVGVVDGGIDLRHEDLAWNCSQQDNHCFVYNYQGTTIYPHDHGTHVAGTIAAVNNNGIGVSGIAGGCYPDKRGVTLLSCQIFKENGRNDLGGDSASAIKWAADHGAVICNNSWGYSYNSEAAALRSNISSTDRQAVDYFNKYAGMDENGDQEGPMAGGLVLFSAGNEAWTCGWPAKYEGVLAVGAMTCKGDRASYSNYGDWVDIAAPGGDDDNGNYGFVWSSLKNNQYGGYAGTSMACPHVCGVAALLVSKLGKKGFTRQELIDYLLEGADPDFLPSSARIGPRCDAYGSFRRATGGNPLPPAIGSATVEKWKASIPVQVPSCEDGTVVDKVICLAGPDKSELVSADPFGVMPDGIVKMEISTSGKNPGDWITFTTDVLSFGTRYYAICYSATVFEIKSDPSGIISFDIPENNPPLVVKQIPATGIGMFSQAVVTKIELNEYFRDPEGEPLSFSATVADKDVASVSMDGSSLAIFPRTDSGASQVVVTASDGFASVSQTFSVVCRNPQTLFDAYPNPVVEMLYLRSSSAIDADVKITSEGGIPVISTHLVILPDGTQPIDCSHLAPGVYFVEVSGKDIKSERKKIVKI